MKETSKSKRERKHTKRKREDMPGEYEPLSDKTPLSVKTPTKITTHIPSYQNVVESGFGPKQSKLTQKPLFKSRKKANPRLSQTNRINNYFLSVGTANMGKGRRESAIMDDLNGGFHQLG